MSTIYIDSVYSQLVTKSITLMGRLEAALTITPKSAFYQQRRSRFIWDGKIRFITPNGRFLTGLMVKVLTIATQAGESIDLVDRRITPSTVPWPTPVALKLRDDYQEAIVQKSVAAERGIIYAATNAGKTEMAIAIAAALKVRTLYIVPSLELIQQTIDRFAVALDTRDGIGIVSGDRFQPGRYLTIVNIQALVRALLTRPGLELCAQTDCVFSDEAHLMSSVSRSAKAWNQFLMKCPAYYRYALSGTPFVGKPERDLKLVGMTGVVLGEVRSAYLVEKGYSARPTVRWTAYKTSTVWSDPDRNFADDYEALIVDNDGRNEAIVETVISRLPRRTLILIARYAHAETLVRMFEAKGHAALYLSGKDSVIVRQAGKRAFRAGSMPILIATKIMGTGVDIKEIDQLVIGSAGKAANQTIQQVGRALRTRDDKREVDIYDFIDRGLYDPAINPHKRYLEEHFKERVKTYTSEEIEQLGLPTGVRRRSRKVKSPV